MRQLIFFMFFAAQICFGQIPEYYQSVNFLETGTTLKNSLSQLITNTHTNLIPYTATNTDTWDVIKESDLITLSDVLLVYGYDDNNSQTNDDRLRDKDLSCHTSSCIGLWNREHVFPKSLANPQLDTSYPSAGTDAHNLRAADSQMNSTRNNRLYEDGSGNASITANGNFYPGDEFKGDVARIIMYMLLRYPNQCESINVGYGSTNTNPEMPDVFLQWNIDDPVTDFEDNRNNTIFLFQGNRNPFIDNPYLATLIWGGSDAEDRWQTLSNDNAFFDTLKIYPTITQNMVYITPQKDKLKYTIFNNLGQQLNQGVTNQYINLQNLEQGLYLIRLENNTKSKVFKVFKQ